ncbi:transcription elongation factor Spt5 [Candidatus Woesearchaeota archaeon]|nr:transcription elongation factor Spt5 [Candidatus Woesearchaeota archaeon]
MAGSNDTTNKEGNEDELKLNLDDTENVFGEAPKKGAEPKVSEKSTEKAAPEERPQIFALRTTANREEQVMDFISSNAKKKKLEVYSLVHPHGMRGYIFMEAKNRQDAEQAAFRIPYARGLLDKEVAYEEIEHMLEPSKKVEVNIQKGDIVEIISGAAFKHSQAKVTRIDKTKEEVVVELLESAVPIPITLKLDAVKVIRRESEEGEAAKHQEE